MNRIPTLLNKFKKSKDKKILLLLCAVFLIFLFFKTPSQSVQELEETEITLVNCIDGDTANFLVNGKEEKVRFLVIDAPEIGKGDTPSDPFGDEAAEYTCNALKNAKEIRFAYEDDRYDRYDRLLAWIFVDNHLLQEQLIQEGLAEVRYVYDDYFYTNVLEVAESVARKEKIGIWSIR